jgi:hypothetical protein
VEAAHDALGDAPLEPERFSRPVRDPREADQLLVRAEELLARGWCQTALALDEEGRLVEPWSPSARSWSLLGALLAAWYEDPEAGRDSFRIAYTALALATGGRLEEWNAARWRTKRHVASAFARARAHVPALRRQLRQAESL